MLNKLTNVHWLCFIINAKLKSFHFLWRFSQRQELRFSFIFISNSEEDIGWQLFHQMMTFENGHLFSLRLFLPDKPYATTCSSRSTNNGDVYGCRCTWEMEINFSYVSHTNRQQREFRTSKMEIVLSTVKVRIVFTTYCSHCVGKWKIYAVENGLL